MRQFGAFAKLNMRRVRGGAADSFARSVPDGRYADRAIAMPLYVRLASSRLISKKLDVLETHLAAAPPNKADEPK